jgi:hypothetical protein
MQVTPALMSSLLPWKEHKNSQWTTVGPHLTLFPSSSSTFVFPSRGRVPPELQTDPRTSELAAITRQVPGIEALCDITHCGVILLELRPISLFPHPTLASIGAPTVNRFLHILFFPLPVCCEVESSNPRLSEWKHLLKS